MPPDSRSEPLAPSAGRATAAPPSERGPTSAAEPGAHEHPTVPERAPDARAVLRDAAARALSRPPPTPTLPAGTMVDHFQVMRLLGRGGMSVVYLARDTKLGRKVALKMVHAELFASEEARARFLFEARTTARFNHPHVITLYAVGEYQDRPYLALEYVEGQDLAERMFEQRLGLREAVRIGLAVAEALVVAHGYGVLHRDLKPGNVLIGRDGRVRVLDFGLAKVVDLDAAPRSQGSALGDTVPRTVSVAEHMDGDSWGVGTPKYMSPEQWRGAECTRATDLWAFGVLCFAMLAGRLPYAHDDMTEHALAVCATAPAPRIDAFADVPPKLAALVASCLAKDPDGRPSAAEAVGVLRTLLESGRQPSDERQSPFRGLLPFTRRHAHLFFGREAEVAAFVERLRLQPVLPVVGPSGVGKSSFIRAGVIPWLLEQEPWTVLELRPGPRPFHALAARLIDLESESSASSTRALPAASSRADASPADRPSAGQGTDSGRGRARRTPALLDDPTLRTLGVAPPAPSRFGAGSAPTEAATAQASTGAEARAEARAGAEAGASAAALASQGDATIDELARKLRHAPSKLTFELRAIAAERGTKVLLFVDQLEELFTLASPEVGEDAVAMQRNFLEALCTATDDALDPVRVVFTLRDDYLGRVALGARVREVLGQLTVILPPDAAALRETLVKPVEALRYRYEDDTLVDEMVAAAGGQTAALAVLQFVASQLWERRDDARRLLLRSAYQRIGGVEGALARHADGVLAGLSPEELKLARAMLLKLVTAEGARKMVPPSQVLGGLGAEGRRVLGRLTQARLVAVTKLPGDATAPIMIELAHESLIRAWQTLARWIDESKDELAFLADVGQAARLWHKRGRRPEELWEGEALHEALRGLEKCTTRPSEQVVAFVAAGRTRQGQRLRRRRWLMAAAFALLAAVALGASLTAAYVARQRNVVAEQRNLAERRRAEALREGARAALGQGNVLEARAKLREALEIEDSPGARALWLQLSVEPLLLRQHFAVPLYVTAAAPDGRTVAVAGQDGVVHLGDSVTGQSRALRGHTDQVMALAYSHDGRWLASAGLDTAVRIWDAASGATVHVASGHRGGIFGLGFSPDGRLLASASADKTVRLWDVSSGEPRGVLEGHEAMVRSVSFSPDGQLLASGAVDRTVRLWDLGAARERQVLRGHEGDVMAVAFSPDGALLASAAYDRTIRLWEPTGTLRRTLTGHVAGIVALSFSPDGQRIASASADKTVRLWEVSTGATLRTLEHDGQVWSVAFGPDGHRLATAAGDKQLRIWDVDVAGARPPPEGHGAAVTSVSFSPDGLQLASAGYDRTIRLWEVRTGRPLRTIEGHEGEVMAVSFSPDGQRLASGGADRTVRLWNAGSGAEEGVLSGHQLQVLSVAFSPDGTRLASASFDRSVRLWDLASGATERLLAHPDRVWDTAFSPDGRLLASGSYDGTARIWNVKTGDMVRVLAGHQDRVYGVRFSPDGKTLFTGSYDHTVRLWDVASGSGSELGSMAGRVYGVDVEPSGRRIVAACSDGTARIWDLATRASVELSGHLNETNAARFSPDGKLVATASDDGTVRLWEAEGGRPFWRAPTLVGSSPELYSHEGWRLLEAGTPSTPQPAQWRTAIEQRAQYASESPDHQLLCIQTYERHLELWELASDRRLGERAVDGLAQVLAAPWGCAVLTADGALAVGRSGEPELLAIEGKPSAMGWGEGRLLVAAGDEVLAFGAAGPLPPRGPALERYRAGAGISALAQSDGSIFVGYRDGTLEALSVSHGPPTAARSFEQVPASPVLRIVPGPADTLFVGYGNGLLGMWSQRDGTQLDRTMLHGPIVHLRVEGQKLYAATELGRFLVRDLSVFFVDHCTLLREVWDRVPVLWQQGQALEQPPPARHRCRR